MTKPFSLQTLLNLSQQQNDLAMRNLGQLNKKQQSAEQILDTLLEYRKDYQKRLQENTRDGMNPADLRNFQQFINKLDEAIIQQLKVVEKSKSSAQVGRGEFDTTQRKLKSFGTLQQRHIEKQNKIAVKTEQNILDEHSSRLAACKIINTESQNE